MFFKQLDVKYKDDYRQWDVAVALKKNYLNNDCFTQDCLTAITDFFNEKLYIIGYVGIGTAGVMVRIFVKCSVVDPNTVVLIHFDIL